MPHKKHYPISIAVLLAAIAASLLLDDEGSCKPKVPKAPRVRGHSSGKTVLPLGDPGEPWSLDTPVRAFDDVCFQDRSSLGGLTETEARRWLEPAKDQPCRIMQASSRGRRTIHFQGLAKLHVTWTPETVMRLSFVSHSVRVWFCHDGEAVVLHNYINWPGPRWAAYHTTCRPGEAPKYGLRGSPQPFVLLSTDDSRAYRTYDDTLDFRCRDGSLVVSKGDVRLLTVPFSGNPTAVYLESKQTAYLRDVALCRSGPAPDDPPQPHTTVVGGRKAPASLDWKHTLPAGARFDRLPDGHVELAAEKTAGPIRATVSLDRPGLYEIIAEVENAVPGSGLFLADEEGRALQGIEFTREQRTGWAALGLGKPGNPLWGANFDPDQGLGVFSGQRQWLRLVLGGGVFRCWSSGDGQHWGQILDPQPQAGPCRQVGIYLQAGDSPRRIQLRSLDVRTLDGLMNLVPADLLAQAAKAGMGSRHESDTDLGAWQQRVAESLPGGGRGAFSQRELNLPPDVTRKSAPSPSLPLSDAEGDGARFPSSTTALQPVAGKTPPVPGSAGTKPATWRAACAIEALAGSTNPPLAKTILEQLLRDRLESTAPLDARLAMLHDAALLYDTWSSADDARRYAAHWERLGRELLGEEDADEFDLFRRSWMTTSQSNPQQRIEGVHWRFAQDRLVMLLAEQSWGELNEWCGQLRFWHQAMDSAAGWPGEEQRLKQLVDWVESEIGRAKPAQPGQRPAAADGAWRRPLAVQLNREAYNALSELQAAVDEGLYPDACRILTSAAVPQGDGLVPDAKDPQQFTSFPAAVRLLVERYPKFREAMNSHLGAADNLRGQQTIAQGNAVAIEALAIQYCGTPIAAAAHAWLGDRSLSRGDFDRALDRYQQALPTTAAAQREQLAARVRLASAMLGRQVGQPTTTTITFGDTQVTPAQFEQWVSEMLQRTRAGNHVSGTGHSLAGRVPHALVQFDSKPWAKLEGDVGQQPGQVPPSAKDTDWPARQLAVVMAEDTMLLANRFQLSALDRATGKRRWTYGLGGEQGLTHGWSLVAMRPVAAGNRVYARLLPKSGHPEIVCLELAGGKRLWQRGCTGDLVTDPLVMRDRLFALVVEAQEGNLGSQLHLVEFDRQSGDVVQRKTLFDLQGPWAAQQVCQATVVGDRIVAGIVGAVVCLDADGQVVWLRSSPCMPPAVDPAAGQQYCEPPLAVGDRLYVALPGARSLECIDLQTGGLHWRQAVVGLRRLLDVAEGRVLIETVEGLVALAADSGQTLWQRELARMLDGHAMVAPGLLLCAQREPLGGGTSCPVLAWIELATGKLMARSPLWGLRGKQPMLGPLVAQGEDLWCFTEVLDQNANLQPQRDISRLVPTGPALPDIARGDFWTGGMDPGLQGAAALLLPGWTILSAPSEDGNGVRAQWNGAHNVLAVKMHPDRTRLARWVEVPAGGKPRLLLELGFEANSGLEVEIRAGDGKLVAVKPDSKSDTWKTSEANLSSYAGRTVLLTMVSRSPGSAWLYFKRAEVQGTTAVVEHKQQ